MQEEQRSKTFGRILLGVFGGIGFGKLNKKQLFLIY
jgi:hypothetical protein